jgi:hypothetical protein
MLRLNGRNMQAWRLPPTDVLTFWIIERTFRERAAGSACQPAGHIQHFVKSISPALLAAGKKCLAQANEIASRNQEGSKQFL